MLALIYEYFTITKVKILALIYQYKAQSNRNGSRQGSRKSYVLYLYKSTNADTDLQTGKEAVKEVEKTVYVEVEVEKVVTVYVQVPVEG